MTPLSALRSAAGTFHALAAAWASILRAAAPPLRTYPWETRMLSLPPVPKAPQIFLRARLVPGVGYSQVTLFQSHSSSSTTNWARPVIAPWPISDLAIRTTTVSSGRITTQAVISGELSGAAAVTLLPNGLRPIASPPPTAALVRMNERREILGALIMAAFTLSQPCEWPHALAGTYRSGRYW